MKQYILKYKGLLTVSILFGTLFSVGSTLVALILKEVIDTAMSRDMDRFVSIILLTAVYLALAAVCYWLHATFNKKFICKVTKMLRSSVFEGIFKKNTSDFRAVNSADYLSALSNDVKNVEENYTIPLLLCLQNIIIFISSFAVMLYLSPLVLLFLVLTMVLLIVVPGLFQKKIQSRQNTFSEKQSGFTVSIKDFLSGFEVIRSYRMNNYILKEFQKKNETVYSAKYGLDKILAVVESMSILLGTFVQCSVLFVSAFLIITGDITAGALVGLVQVSGTIVGPISTLSENIPKIQGSRPIIERLNNLVNYSDNSFTGTLHPTFQTDIMLNNLQFGYEEQTQIIQGITFSFKKGKKYAVVGKSGCGKTTLINLLGGCYAGFEGDVLYDGINMRELDIEKLNEMSSVIHQSVYMFDESIQDNICLHKQVSPADLHRALVISGVDMFLGSEKTLDSPVGENGNNLSGGQRQRIAVARALVQRKPILVLDEGTSAIDMQTAYDIESQLIKIRDLTVITITHSMNAELLRDYDEIIFMENGRILDSDTFENLVRGKGAFYNFYSLKK